MRLSTLKKGKKEKCTVSIYFYYTHLYSLISMINTYNESTLHATLKKHYAEKYNGTIEQSIETYFCDVVSGSSVYEIQTANISSLKNKIQYLIHNYTVTIVYPVAENTIIETRSPDGTILSTRKSPKKGNIYHIFKEITGLISYLGNKSFSIHVLLTDQKDIRIRVSEPVQLKNKSRHWRKNWIKHDKELLSINSEMQLDSLENFRNLITSEIDSKSSFTIKDLEKTKIGIYSRVAVWVLKKALIIEETEKKGRQKQYILNKKSLQLAE